MNKKSQRISEIIEAFAGKKVIVWGDIILDEYLYGTTRRISREAPVLVLSYKNREYALGGAGNSLFNLRSMGAPTWVPNPRMKRPWEACARSQAV